MLQVLLPRKLPVARIGDIVTIDFTGAYCSSMCTKGYNSFPETAEVLVDKHGEGHLIRR
jgi:diaminopimelate decarboxylase